MHCSSIFLLTYEKVTCKVGVVVENDTHQLNGAEGMDEENLQNYHTRKGRMIIMKTTTMVITKVETMGTDNDIFYTVESNNSKDIISKETLFDIIRKSYNLEIELAEDMDEIDLTYIEVFHSLDGGDEIDVYEHVTTIDEDRGLRTKENLLKTYKQESSAVKFAHKQNAYKVIEF